MISELMFDCDDLLVETTAEYAALPNEYDLQVFEEINDISNRLKQLGQKLEDWDDIAIGSWRYDPDWVRRNDKPEE